MLCSLTGPAEGCGTDDPPGRTTLHTRHKRILVAGGLAVLLLGALVTAVSAVGPSGFCGSCHAMRPYSEAHASGEHADAGCLSCHAPSIADRAGMCSRVVFGMFPRAIVGVDDVFGAARGTPDDGCVSCHDREIEEPVDRKGIKVLHLVCASESACVDCHGVVPHGDVVRVTRAFTMESCTECHQREKASLECDACHSEHTQHERLERGSWQATHGSQWSKTHGLGSLRSCGVCHPSDYCVRCHGTALPHPVGFGQSHGTEVLRDPEVCVSCHETETLCTPCHGIEMPHPDGFLKEHSSVAVEVEDPACARCHDIEECVACHVRHVHPGNAIKLPKVGE